MSRVIMGDYIYKLRQIESDSIDMIISDLYYNEPSFSTFSLDDLWTHYKRILKKDGVIALLGVEPYSSLIRCSNLSWYRYDWIWKKERPSNPNNANKTPLKSHENICIFYNRSGRYKPQGLKEVNIKRRAIKEEDQVRNHLGHIIRKEYVQKYTNYPDSIISFDSERGLHPAQKPVELCEYLIKTYTNEGETILDNCAGSGTTGIAAIRTNRKYILIEKNEYYYSMIKERISLELLSRNKNIIKNKPKKKSSTKKKKKK